MSMGCHQYIRAKRLHFARREVLGVLQWLCPNYQGAEMYPEIMLIPMREELTRVGAQELRTAEEVDRALANQAGTTMVVVNSIWGCAAGRMRPGVRRARHPPHRRDNLVTVVPAQDTEATDRARSYSTGDPLSSP